jgi:hypothetical protein
MAWKRRSLWLRPISRLSDLAVLSPISIAPQWGSSPLLLDSRTNQHFQPRLPCHFDSFQSWMGFLLSGSDCISMRNSRRASNCRWPSLRDSLGLVFFDFGVLDSRDFLPSSSRLSPSFRFSILIDKIGILVQLHTKASDFEIRLLFVKRRKSKKWKAFLLLPRFLTATM